MKGRSIKKKIYKKMIYLSLDSPCTNLFWIIKKVVHRHKFLTTIQNLLKQYHWFSMVQSKGNSNIKFKFKLLPLCCTYCCENKFEKKSKICYRCPALYTTLSILFLKKKLVKLVKLSTYPGRTPNLLRVSTKM